MVGGTGDDPDPSQLLMYDWGCPDGTPRPFNRPLVQ